MKNYLLAFCLSFISLSFAQTKEKVTEKKIGDFSTVKVYDRINLIMKKSKENKVFITGKNRDDVQILNKNGKLKIRMKLEESFDGNKTFVELHYTSIDVIDANEGAKIEIEEVIEQNKIELKVQEGAHINVELDTNLTVLKVSTGGYMDIQGKSKSQEISISTGGKIYAENFITEQTKININAGGSAYITATEKVIAKTKAGGNIYIYGNPKQADESSALGGRIVRM